jgi:hypothetical protein
MPTSKTTGMLPIVAVAFVAAACDEMKSPTKPGEASLPAEQSTQATGGEAAALAPVRQATAAFHDVEPGRRRGSYTKEGIAIGTARECWRRDKSWEPLATPATCRAPSLPSADGRNNTRHTSGPGKRACALAEAAAHTSIDPVSARRAASTPRSFAGPCRSVP